MAIHKSHARYTFDELAIWRTKLPQAELAVLPPSNNRPNPLATDTTLYVSVFSPGAVYALDRKTGEIVWRREIPKFGGSAVQLAGGKLFAKTPNTLFALEPETGRTLWSFCPYASQPPPSEPLHWSMAHRWRNFAGAHASRPAYG